MNTERCFTKVSSFGNALSSIAQSMFVDFVRLLLLLQFSFSWQTESCMLQQPFFPIIDKNPFQKYDVETAIIISRFFRSVKKIFYVFPLETQQIVVTQLVYHKI